MMWDQDAGWGNWLAMSLMMLVFWGAVIALVVWLTRRTTNQNTSTPPRQPEDVLAERFARGDIDEVEYQQRLAVLRGRPADGSARLSKTGNRG